jgi:RimJ/RimL family protein N-acetyltransferase
MQIPGRVEGQEVYLVPVSREAATLILSGSLPSGLQFAEGYPGEFSLEVMDIFVGERVQDATGFTPFFIVRRADDRIVGDIGFSFPDGRPESPTAGYDVIEPLWGKGYATAALRALLAFVLARPGIESVRADTLKTHVASRRVMEKAGMRFVREGVDDVDGEKQELVYYEVVAGSQARSEPQ